ncbi:MAG: PqqD family protein [Deltaproteobacteria bacterium]|nr:PqqD family protein [Deltaproteobacteria bacterium]
MKDDIILAEVDGEGMIIDVEKSTSYFLNETALFVFKLLNEGKNTDDIKAAMLREYDVDATEVENDIREFIGKLDRKAVSWAKKNMSDPI